MRPVIFFAPSESCEGGIRRGGRLSDLNPTYELPGRKWVSLNFLVRDTISQKFKLTRYTSRVRSHKGASRISARYGLLPMCRGFGGFGFSAKPPQSLVRVSDRHSLRDCESHRDLLPGKGVVRCVNQHDPHLVLAGCQVGYVDCVAVARICPPP